MQPLPNVSTISYLNVPKHGLEIVCLRAECEMIQDVFLHPLDMWVCQLQRHLATRRRGLRHHPHLSILCMYLFYGTVMTKIIIWTNTELPMKVSEKYIITHQYLLLQKACNLTFCFDLKANYIIFILTRTVH